MKGLRSNNYPKRIISSFEFEITFFRFTIQMEAKWLPGTGNFPSVCGFIIYSLVVIALLLGFENLFRRLIPSFRPTRGLNSEMLNNGVLGKF